ncbi:MULTISPECIES: biotin transporter BioY [Pasteurellaceae]|uniref:Biotin transporter n=1 Tax=Pasteurella atlantica TaxID=2827233 RepID=A0AAW8CP00_9PAST|nr:biotin transporter BioY [Pasteurella atlantica]MBR0573285.1 biotin transporter BioY [Pasteurella atlantica]MDP8039099.1 biotin transporter BioY [Pasteurella atlantica]MDP8041302.1 biotin transporter BioY [Pasteurella atlantica]MDP8043439.1 biotin transporter BioY [Pasteurella atlantica]MDP8045525.1 biotin transporter BioY [Pasteurella atlantica]
MFTKDIVYISLFASLTATLGLFPTISLPFISVPITIQSIACMLAGAIAGSKRGALAMLLFIVLVMIGLPLLSGGRGGFGILLGPTGGFLIGWIAGAYLIGLLYEKVLKRGFLYEFLFIALGGIVIVYGFGIPWLSIATEMTIKQATIGSLAFIPGDIAKVVLALYIVKMIRKGYPDFILTK